MQNRPDHTEYSTFNARYIDQVPDVDIASYMEEQRSGFLQFIRSIPEEKAQYAYGPDKWSIAQVLQHIIDSERVFSYRLLSVARGDKTPLPGYEQNDWALEGTAKDRTLADLAAEFDLVRKATIVLLNSLEPNQLLYGTTASDHYVSARALVWIMAGHVVHHQRVLEERYL